MKKHQGRYTTAIEKARTVQGYPAPVQQMQGHRKLSQMASKVELTYLKEYGPLSECQAEAVVIMAGIELTTDLRTNIEKAVSLEPTGQPTVVKT